MSDIIDPFDFSDIANISLRNCKFAFRCNQRWQELATVPNEANTKFCSECSELVYLCDNDEQLVFHVRQNHCVAICVPTPKTDFGWGEFRAGSAPVVGEEDYRLGFVAPKGLDLTGIFEEDSILGMVPSEGAGFNREK